MTYDIRETKYDTYVVVDDNGLICGEFIDRWEADDWRDFLEEQELLEDKSCYSSTDLWDDL